MNFLLQFPFCHTWEVRYKTVKYSQENQSITFYTLVILAIYFSKLYFSGFNLFFYNYFKGNRR